MEQKIVQRCETEIVVNSCNASYVFRHEWFLNIARPETKLSGFLTDILKN